MNWVRFWRLLIGIFSALIAIAEAIALRSKDPKAPLCHMFRVTCRLDAQPGRVAFILGWVVFSVWFIPHLIRQTSEASSLTMDS